LLRTYHPDRPCPIYYLFQTISFLCLFHLVLFFFPTQSSCSPFAPSLVNVTPCESLVLIPDTLLVIKLLNMSEVQNSVEEQPAAPVEATPIVEPTTEAKAEETPAPAVEETTTAAEPAKDEEPAAAPEVPATTTKAATPKKEFTGEGILGYKAPGGNFMK
jgi:hypothetical protein